LSMTTTPSKAQPSPQRAEDIARKLTKENLDRIWGNCIALKDFIKNCTAVMDAWRNAKKRLDDSDMMVIEMRGRAEGRLELAQRSLETNRMAHVEFGITNTLYIPTSDLDRFSIRVDELFTKWINVKQSPFDSPTFPMIQSNGMGKTKLLFEYKKSQNNNPERKVLLIRCVTQGSSYDSPGETIYDGVLQIAPWNDRDYVLGQLEEFIQGSSVGKSTSWRQIVLLFDEAQHLTAEDGFQLRAIRWWLKKKINSSIAAVFSGTSLSLAPIYRERPMTTTSRDGPSLYRNDDAKYYPPFPPFFELCTSGCFARMDKKKKLDDETVVADKQAKTDYELAIPYGRPLFTVMQKDGSLEEKTPIILQKMLLDEDDWCNCDPSVLSVLATRVQTGQAVTSIASSLVGKGYAFLTSYTPMDGSNHRGVGTQQGIAEFCYLTDPVCARLAMSLMDEKWESRDGKFKGKDPKFWTSKALEIFTRGICWPNKGDVGEIGAALYLLFCGDRIRKKVQKTLSYDTFAIPFDAWLNSLMDPASGDEALWMVSLAGGSRLKIHEQDNN
jgi:hypothetical protein